MTEMTETPTALKRALKLLEVQDGALEARAMEALLRMTPLRRSRALELLDGHLTADRMVHARKLLQHGFGYAAGIGGSVVRTGAGVVVYGQHGSYALCRDPRRCTCRLWNGQYVDATYGPAPAHVSCSHLDAEDICGH